MKKEKKIIKKTIGAISFNFFFVIFIHDDKKCRFNSFD